MNAYLRQISGEDFTAEDFRTWAGTVLASAALCELGDGDSPTAIRWNLSAVIKPVAARLGNTAAVCRKCYIHPAVIAAYEATALVAYIKSQRWPAAKDGMSPQETALLTFLKGNRRRRRTAWRSLRPSAQRRIELVAESR